MAGLARALLGVSLLGACDRIAGYDDARPRPSNGDAGADGGAIDPPSCEMRLEDPTTGQPGNPLRIPRAPTPPRLVQELDRTWCFAPAVPIARGPDGAGRTTAKGWFRALYDDQALYVSIDVVDASLRASEFFFSDNDGVDVVMDMNASGSSTYEPDDLYVGLEIGSREVHRIEGAPARDFPTADIKMFEVPGGARWQMALPWADVPQAAPAASTPVGLEVQIRDENGAANDQRFRWFSTSGDGIKRPMQWGAARFE